MPCDFKAENTNKHTIIQVYSVGFSTSYFSFCTLALYLTMNISVRDWKELNIIIDSIRTEYLKTCSVSVQVSIRIKDKHDCNCPLVLCYMQVLSQCLFFFFGTTWVSFEPSFLLIESLCYMCLTHSRLEGHDLSRDYTTMLVNYVSWYKYYTAVQDTNNYQVLWHMRLGLGISEQLP